MSYYVYWFTPWLRPGMGAKGASGLSKLKFDAPPLIVIDTFVFCVFAVVCIFMLLGSVSSRSTFKPADVDVLFPTPLSPQIVLGFRMIRDSLATLILPLIIALFAVRPVTAGWDALFRNLPPGASSQAQRSLWVAWLLLSVFTVLAGYATGLYFNRPENSMTKIRSRAAWMISLITLALVSIIVYEAVRQGSLVKACDFLSEPLVRAPFFIANAATHIVISPLIPSAKNALLGYSVLLASIGTALWLALKQAPFLYEQAAERAGFIKSRTAQMQGDTMSVLAEQARHGKLKSGGLAARFSRLSVRGPWALVWKDLVLFGRTSRFLIVLAPALIGIFALGIVSSSQMRNNSNSVQTAGIMLMFIEAMLIFLFTIIAAHQGYMEMLKRVDLQKPLPFTPSKIVLYEVGAKALPSVIVGIFGALFFLVIKPPIWQYSIAAIVLTPTFALMLSAVTFGVTILFPDYEDPTQRSLRGLVQMLSIIIFAAPGVTTLAVALAFNVPPILACLLPSAINFGLSLLAAVASGNIYANYNPSE